MELSRLYNKRVALLIAITAFVVLAPTMPISLFNSPLTSNEAYAAGCTGKGNTSLPVKERPPQPAQQPPYPALKITSPSFTQASLDIAAKEAGEAGVGLPIPQHGTSKYLNNTFLNLYDFNKDGKTDCAIVKFPIMITYVVWTNVGSFSKCVQDAWYAYLKGPVVAHEHHHRDDHISVLANAHLLFVGKSYSKNNVQSILDKLENQITKLGNAWDAKDYPHLRSTFPRCCAGATYNDQKHACVCSTPGATYNEKGGTPNNPNGGCSSPGEGKTGKRSELRDYPCPLTPLAGPGGYIECETRKAQQLNAQYCQKFPEICENTPGLRG